MGNESDREPEFDDELRAQFREVDREDAPMLLRMLAEYELEVAGQLEPGEYVDHVDIDVDGRAVIAIARDPEWLPSTPGEASEPTVTQTPMLERIIATILETSQVDAATVP